MSEIELARLEDEFPALAAEASRDAHAAALAVGSVLVVQDHIVVEVFRDGRRVPVGEVPPGRDLAPGTTIRARA